MSDYIEREAVRQAHIKANLTTRLIDALPAADVAPVRHGRWIKPVPGDGEPYCSECHAEQPWFYGYGYYESDCCPHCGAVMDKKREAKDAD